MNKLNFLQPDKNNLNTYLYTGSNFSSTKYIYSFFKFFF